MLPLLDSFWRKWAARHIQCRTESGSECKKLRMLQGEFGCSKPSHGYSNNCAFVAACCRRESAFNIGNEIVDDVIFIPVFRMFRRICVIGGIAFGHHQNEVCPSKTCDIRVVCPIAKATAATM